jgi:hypothetical protein
MIFFSFSVVYLHTTRNEHLAFELNPGEEVSVAGPSSDTIYQGLAAVRTTASETFHFQTEKGQAANITKPFVFTIS